MSTPIPEGLYVPTPLVDGVAALLTSHLPADVEVDVNGDRVPARGVLLWAATPLVERLTMAGPTGATLRVTARSVDETPALARVLGDRVRLLLASLDIRGRHAYPIVVDGFKVDLVIASEGHSGNDAGIGQWTEVFTLHYQADAVEPTVG